MNSTTITRNRRLSSIKGELLTKSREAMLCAVQTFNNPNIQFKSENFIVLSNIAWTYMLHAYYRDQKIEYKYHEVVNSRKRFHKTKNGAYKFWELERCLNDSLSPIDKTVAANLRFLIGLRHEIEHQMTTRIDDFLSARLQACCLNYNSSIKQLFGDSFGIDKYLSFSLQFSSISEEHATQLRKFEELPKNISAYINAFDESLSEDDYNDAKYSYRVLYIPKMVNHKGQADKVIEFMSANSPEAQLLNKELVILRDREKKKYLPSDIKKAMENKGFKNFTIHEHTKFWQTSNAKDKNKNFGVLVVKTWYWYENWLEEVEKYCRAAGNRYI